jgi:hypothetical protein
MSEYEFKHYGIYGWNGDSINVRTKIQIPGTKESSYLHEFDSDAFAHLESKWNNYEGHYEGVANLKFISSKNTSTLESKIIQGLIYNKYNKGEQKSPYRTPWIYIVENRYEKHAG